MKNQQHLNRRTQALLEAVHPQSRIRYSTCLSQTSWRNGVQDSAIPAFLDRQDQLSCEIKSALAEDSNSVRLTELFWEYLSNPFDLLGYSISTKGVLGLQTEHPGTTETGALEKLLYSATGTTAARLST